MKFKPIHLSEDERVAFVKYMRASRNFSENTIRSVLGYLTVTTANTKASRRKARYARTVYNDFRRVTGRDTIECVEEEG